MSPELQSLYGRCVTEPTPERPTWLVRFDYVLLLDGDAVPVLVETEFCSEQEIYLLSIKADHHQIDRQELTIGQYADLMAEAKATARAFEIFGNAKDDSPPIDG